MLVTGASSGIGRAVAVHFSANGHRVFGMVRSETSGSDLVAESARRGGSVELVVADVRDATSVVDAVRHVVNAAGGIDVLVNSAGVPAGGVLEDTSPELFTMVMDVNLLGTVRSIQAVLPTMREKRSGWIVNVSSNAGRVAVLAQSAYVASKWALEGVSEGLAHELAPFGIRVLIVEPGVTKSAIFDKANELPPRGGPYELQYRRMARYYKRAKPQAAEAEEVALAIERAMLSENPPLRVACGFGGASMIEGRERVSDEAWVAMGGLDDEGYFNRFHEVFGIDLS